ncbi:MAG: luciferase family oxidoreductase group 1 [Paraglaciecola sp.]|jgi:luciferase family oxidoreductase group 1
MLPFSILDLAPIAENSSISEALANTQTMAVKAEQCGYHRVWLAEHHAMQGVASSATAVVIGSIGAVTNKIRIGAGGIMLPNHSPLIVAEQFGTLAELFPNRVDLGLGRAPGTDMATARALRRNLNAGVEDYPKDIQELQSLLGPVQAGQNVMAIPGANTNIPLWLLGSSLYSAQLAARLGLPYTFASHFAPDQLFDAINLYKTGFRPSQQLQKPYVMAGVMAVVADTDEEAQYLFTSVQQQFVNLRRGVNRPFALPVDDMSCHWSAAEKAMVEHTLQYAIVGNKQQAQEKLTQFIENTQIDELILSVPIHNMQARLKTLEIMSDMGVMQKY